MTKYRVNVIELSGMHKAVHKSGEVLEVSQIPGGKENAEKLVKSGHLVVDSDDELEAETEDQGGKENAGDEAADLTPKEKAEALITEAKELEGSGDLLGALEKLNEAENVYTEGRKAPKLIAAITEKLG